MSKKPSREQRENAPKRDGCGGDLCSLFGDITVPWASHGRSRNIWAARASAKGSHGEGGPLALGAVRKIMKIHPCLKASSTPRVPVAIAGGALLRG